MTTAISVIIRGHGHVDCNNYTATPENVNVTFPVRKSQPLIGNRTISLIDQFKYKTKRVRHGTNIVNQNHTLSKARDIRTMSPNTLIKNMNIMLKCFYQHNGSGYAEPINNNIGKFTYSGIINSTRSLLYMGELAQNNRLPENIKIIASGLGRGFIDKVTDLCPDMTGYFYILYFGYSDYSNSDNKKNPIFGIVNSKSYYCVFLNEIKNRSKSGRNALAYKSMYNQVRDVIAYSDKSWLKNFNTSETSENVIRILDNNMSNYINDTIYERIIDMSYIYHDYNIISKEVLIEKNYTFTLGNIFNYIKIYNQRHNLRRNYYPVVDHCHVLTCRIMSDNSEAYDTPYSAVSANSRTCSTTNNRLTAPQLMRVESVNNRYKNKFSNIWTKLRSLANGRPITGNNRSTSGTTSSRNNRNFSEINILNRIRDKYNRNGNLNISDFGKIVNILNRP